MNNSQIKLNQSQLKIIAVISMFIDHFSYGFHGTLPQDVYLTGRSIGRMAFPIFAFMLVEGFFHTRNRIRHLGLLLVFGLFCEIPFDKLIDGASISSENQNVLLTLLLGFVGMMIMESAPKMYFPLAFLLPFIAEFTHMDYGLVGLLTIYLFYMISKNHGGDLSSASADEITSCLIPLFVDALSWHVEFFCILAVPFLCLYNGERGRSNKYFFYVFYPLHFLIIWMLTLLI